MIRRSKWLRDVVTSGAKNLAIICAIGLCAATSAFAQVTLDAGPDLAICQGYSSTISVKFSGATAPIHFSWSPSLGLSDPTAQSPIVTPFQSETQYIVTLSDAANHTVSDTVQVHMNPKVFANAGVDFTTCFGSSVSLGASQTASGGTMPYTYDWQYLPSNANSHSVSNPVYTANRLGYSRYILHVVDAVGCEAWDTVVVTVNQPLKLSVGTGAEGCAFSVHAIGGLGIAGGGTAPYKYQWSPARGLSSATIPNPTAFPDSTTSYVLTITDAQGCTRSDSVLIKVKPRIRTRLVRKVTVCPNTTVNLADSDFVYGGVGSYKYKWSNTDGQFISNDSIANPYTIPVRKANSGTALYTVDIVDALGCQIRDTVLVNITEPPGANFPLTGTVCQNDTLLYAVSGQQGFSYNWTVTGGEIVNGNGTQTVLIRWTTPGVGTLELSVYDPITNCTSNSGANKTYINPLPQPSIVVRGKTILCTGSGATTILDAGPGFALYRWSTGESSQRIVVSHGGLYTVWVQDSNGCRNTSPPQLITEIAPPKPVISGPSKICGGVPVQLHATPGFKQYAWNTGETDSVITINGPGSYSVLVADSIGCSGASDPYTVDPRPVMITTSGDPDFQAVETGLIYPSKIVSYKNTTTEDVIIDSLLLRTTNIDLVIQSISIGSTYYQQSQLHGLRLTPGQQLDIELMYNPTIKDVNDYSLKLYVAAPCVAEFDINGKLASYDKTMWATASVPDRSANPNDHFTIPLYIQFDSPQDSVDDASLSIDFKINGYMMDVDDNAGGAIQSIDTLANSWKILHLHFDHLTIKYNEPFLLTNIHAWALASTKLKDTMFLDDRSIQWANVLKKPKVRTRNGIFTLGTYCYPHDLVWTPVLLRSLRVEPNPVSNELIVELSGDEDADLAMSIVSSDGRIVDERSLHHRVGDGPARVDVSALPSGVYIVKVQSSAELKTQTFIVYR